MPENRPQFPDRFSVLVRRSDGFSSRVYRDSEKLRKDSLLPDGSPSEVSILRSDLGYIFSIKMKDRTFLRIPLNKVSVPMWQDHYENSHWEPVGVEEIEGDRCAIFHVEIPVLAGRERKLEMAREIVHVSERTNWLRRAVTIDRGGNPRLVTDWLEASFDPIPSEIFELPVDFDEVSITGRVIKKAAKKAAK
jgi:hypothetical protein